MNYKIYRLCRNRERIRELKEQEKRYSLPETEYISGIDLYAFINKVIKDCQQDYALLTHDDVILPQNIRTNLKNCIDSADKYFGGKNWGVIGNAGLEIISKKTITFISDPHTNILPYHTKKPILVESVDGNTILINIKTFKEKKVTLPKELSGYHLYDVILCMEAYKKGLVCAISSWLYVKHLSKGNYDAFKQAIKEYQYQKYFRSSFSNHTITTINGLIEVDRNYEYLYENDLHLDSYEKVVSKVVNTLFESKKIHLNILIRIHTKSRKLIRLLHFINVLQQKTNKNITINVVLGINNITKAEIKSFIDEVKKIFSNLNIIDLYVPNNDNQYPRVNTLKYMINSLEKVNHSYSWIIDYDDYIMPEIASSLQYMLFDEDIVIGDSYVFQEVWEEKSDYPLISHIENKISINNIKKIFSGKIYLPICSVIYRTKILEKVFTENDLVGDYFEDYAILLLAIKESTYKSVPLPFAGISYHGKNTVLEKNRTHWDYSYTTFLSEIVNKGLISKVYYDNMSAMHPTEYLEFEGFKKGLIWRLLQKYRVMKKKIINIFN